MTSRSDTVAADCNGLFRCFGGDNLVWRQVAIPEIESLHAKCAVIESSASGDGTSVTVIAEWAGHQVAESYNQKQIPQADPPTMVRCWHFWATTTNIGSDHLGPQLARADADARGRSA